MTTTIITVLGALMIGFGIGVYKTEFHSPEKKILTPEQKISEQNELSKVAVQLRQSEKGYLAEMKNGELLRICRGGETIHFCDVTVGGADNRRAIEVAKSVKRVIGPRHKDWGDISFTFTRGERTK